MPLTEKGRKQAAATAEYLKDVNFSAVYSSDLIRAYETAEQTARVHGLPVIADKNLREIYAGEWEGRTFSDLVTSYPEEYVIWRDSIHLSRPTGGESMSELDERIWSAINVIAKRHVGQKVFIATHATPIRLILRRLKGLPFEELNKVSWVSNASVTTVKYEDGKFTLIQEGYDAHLDGMCTRLSAVI